MRKLASIQIIETIEPIPGEENILKATVLGWELIIKKDEFKVGDKCIYIEIDSIVPEKPEFEFLRSRKFRIRTIKIRGQISQGIALPLKGFLKNTKLEIDDDVTELLKIEKYDPQLIAERKLSEKRRKKTNPLIRFLMKSSWFRKWYSKKKKFPLDFPNWIKKTDENRIQSNPLILEKYKGLKFIVTEKLEGMSATFYINKEIENNKVKLGVCSRNLELIDENNDYWTIEKQFNIKNALSEIGKSHNSVVLQGEIIGEDIQNNIYKIKGKDFYVFNLIIDGQALNALEAKELLTKYNIKFVPILEYEFELLKTVPEMVSYSTGISKLYNRSREGIVLRNYEHNISFKVINPTYLIKSKL